MLTWLAGDSQRTFWFVVLTVGIGLLVYWFLGLVRERNPRPSFRDELRQQVEVFEALKAFRGSVPNVELPEVPPLALLNAVAWLDRAGEVVAAQTRRLSGGDEGALAARYCAGLRGLRSTLMSKAPAANDVAAATERWESTFSTRSAGTE